MPMKWIAIGLVASYPLLVHAAVLTERPLLQWWALFNLTAAVLLPGLLKRRPVSWLALFGSGVALFFLTRWGGGIYALYLPSLVIPGLLLWVFANTLRRAEVPLISRIAEVQSGAPLPPAVARYTRTLTVLWSILFGLMIFDSLLLIALDEKALWSLMTNFIHYLLAAAFFVLEYPYRCWRFPERRQPSFLAYLRKSLTMNLRAP